MIVVTGATGVLGGLIVEALLQQRPASIIGVSVRDPDKAAGIAARGVRVRRGDFGAPDDLAHAFADATTVLLVSSNARSYRGDPIAQHRAAIDAARAAGVRRIVYTSQIAASHTSHFAPARDHATTEDLLRASGLKYTALRHGFYASSMVAMLAPGFERGVLVAPADGVVSFTAHEDLAAAAAAILLDDGCFEGPTPPLTADVALDLAGLAAIATAQGRPTTREVVDDDAYRAQLIERGTPPPAADFVLGMYRASRAGEFAAVDGTLQRLIGRAPIGIGTLLAKQLAR
ncbi:MAG TPA: NAD(P)H-binding protein [Myxococcota bacterium]